MGRGWPNRKSALGLQIVSLSLQTKPFRLQIGEVRKSRCINSAPVCKLVAQFAKCVVGYCQFAYGPFQFPNSEQLGSVCKLDTQFANRTRSMQTAYVRKLGLTHAYIQAA